MQDGFRNRLSNRAAARWLVLILALGLYLPALSQVPAAPTAEEETATTEEQVDDPLGRSSPRGTFTGYIDAVSAQDYARAAEYLDLSLVPPEQRAEAGPEIARNLQIALDRGGDVPPAVMLSDEAEGRLDDDLDPRLDRLGIIELGDEEIPLLVQRYETAEQPVWLIAGESLQALPFALDERDLLNVEGLIPPAVARIEWRGVSLGQWIAVVLLGLLAYLVSHLITAIIARLLHLATRRRLSDYGEGVLAAFVLPARIYLAVLLFIFAGQQLGISIVVRQYFGELTVIVAWAAVLLFGWRLVTIVGAVAESHVTERENFGALAAILLFRRAAKIAVVVIGIIIVLNTLGFDVTTGLAALGIGGLAVALGAQKTIENLVGSLTLIFDQPVRVGDFCKVGDTLGTVEHIGMRSTRIRTLQRTMVVIPNGDFSSQKIENFAPRDMFLFNPILGLRQETTPDQLRYLLVELRALLYAHPKIDPEGPRVRLLGLAQGALRLEFFAYIFGTDFDDFMEVQEDLYLHILRIVAESGTDFAFSSQTIYLTEDRGTAPDKTAAAEDRVRQWRERGELHLPKFDPQRIDELRRTICYPEAGSSAHRAASE